MLKANIHEMMRITLEVKIMILSFLCSRISNSNRESVLDELLFMLLMRREEVRDLRRERGYSYHPSVLKIEFGSILIVGSKRNS